MLEQIKPMEIEARSFEIITELLGSRKLDPENELVIKRAIHTTADFDYADNLVFSPHAVKAGIEALKSGCDIVTDTQMAKAGINKTILASLGGEVHCFMADPDVAQKQNRAESRGRSCRWKRRPLFRSPAFLPSEMRRQHFFPSEHLMEEGKLSPAHHRRSGRVCERRGEQRSFILEGNRAPYIIARGRKGGSNVAAAICNAMLYQIKR